MPEGKALRRLGAGRWETRDGRFTVEPQSGTWVVVDNAQTNELGLPLVRGPYPSLTAAREAIESARTEGPAESPLAGRIASAPVGSGPARDRSKGASTAGRRPNAAAEPPPEPKWLRDLDRTDHRRATRLISRLTADGVEDAEAIVRAEIAGGRPALARLALERRLAAAAATNDPAAAVRAAVKVMADGRDDDLKVRWHLVDGDGRPIGSLDVPD